MLLKRLIKGVAERNGYQATFMSKPFQNLAGSGMHVHISLVNDNNENVFTQGDMNNKQLRHAVAGLLAVMPESMLIYAPNANSYRRFTKGMFVPLNLNWGYDNRTVALRIPSGSPSARRIEHRVSGADANPYLLTASILAGMHHGLVNKLEPPAVSTGDAGQNTTEHTLPNSWQRAIESFASAEILPTYLGRDFCKIYSEVKLQEYEMFTQEITPLEYDWYLRNS